MAQWILVIFLIFIILLGILLGHFMAIDIYGKDARNLKLGFLTAASFVIIFLQNQITWTGVLLSVVSVVLISAGYTYLEKGALPKGNIFLLFLCALIFMVYNFTSEGQIFFKNRLIGAVAVSIPLLIFSKIFKDKGQIGLWEILLAAAGGLVLGWKAMLVALAASLIFMCGAPKERRLAPFLCAGIWAAAAFYQVIIKVL